MIVSLVAVWFFGGLVFGFATMLHPLAGRVAPLFMFVCWPLVALVVVAGQFVHWVVDTWITATSDDAADSNNQANAEKTP